MVESSFDEGRNATATALANFTYIYGAEGTGISYPLHLGFDSANGATQIEQLEGLFNGEPSAGPAGPYDNRQGFYQLYASIMNEVIQEATGDTDLATVTERANNNFRDIVVLTSDLDYIQGPNAGVNIIADNRGNSDASDDLLAIDGYPFYNMVTITPPLGGMQGQYKISGLQNSGLGPGMGPNDSVFWSLRAAGVHTGIKNWETEFNTLVSALQLIICKSLSATPEGTLAPILATGISGSAVATFARGNNDSGLEIGHVRAPILTDSDARYNLPVAFELERLLSYMSPNYPQAGPLGPTPPTAADEELARHLYVSWKHNNNSGNQDKNFTILRDPANVLRWPYSSAHPDEAHPAADLMTLMPLVQSLLYRISLRSRALGDVWHGTPAFSETFMHVVEKRVIPAGATTADLSQPPVQKLYFGLKYDSPATPIKYIDTQIKYGVRYQYDLKEVRMVIGNRYRYDSAAAVVNVSDPGDGRAMANALGLYKEEGDRAVALVPLEEKLSTNLHMASSILYKLPGTTTVYDLIGSYDAASLAFGLDNDAPYVFNITRLQPNVAHDQTATLSVDWTKLTYEIKDGFGAGGNETGGAVPGLPEPYTPPPEDDSENDVGIDQDPDPGLQDPLGDIVDDPAATDLAMAIATQLLIIFGDIDPAYLELEGAGTYLYSWPAVGTVTQLNALVAALTTYENSSVPSMAILNLVSAMENAGIDMTWYVPLTTWGVI